MTVVPPASGEPRRPDGPRNPGDAWVIAPSGEKYWGRFGAAGLLAFDPARGVLLQHRVSWSHFGGTWGLPGGAMHEGESAILGAVREAQEEAGVPDGAVRPRATSVLDLDVWTYTTVIADVVESFEPVISDPESVALEWVPVEEVESLPLHPGFGAAWPVLRRLLEVRLAVVVDAGVVDAGVLDAGVIASAGVASSPHGLAVPSDEVGLEGSLWFADLAAVAGDDAVVAEVARRADAGETVIAVTSDRELQGRVVSAGAAQARSADWLRGIL